MIFLCFYLDFAAGYDKMCDMDISGGRVSGTVYGEHEKSHLELLDKVFFFLCFCRCFGCFISVCCSLVLYF